jgi:hypothetical protein
VSQIAAALARKKGKKVDPVPSQESVVPAIHASVPPMPARPAEAAPAKKNVRTYVLAGGGALALLVTAWLVLRPEPTPPPAPAVAASAPAQPAVAAPVPKPAAKPTALPAEKSADAAGPMAPVIEDQLSKLNITARRPGKGARIVVGGKVFEPGDTVIPGVLLDSVQADRVIFRNAENQRFERRF